MKKRSLLSLFLTLSLLMGALAACAPATQQPAAPGGGTAAGQPAQNEGEAAGVGRGVTIAIDSETPTLAPGRHGSVHGHWKNIMTHNGLFRIAYNLQPVPDIVSDWRAISDTLFEFALHEGIMFHNGEELTAEDVAASFEYMRNFPEGAAQRTAAQRVEAVDRYTFTIYTGTPNALLFTELAHQANFILPKSFIDAGNDFNQNPIGSGPFVFDDWQFGNSLTFNRFDDYFDAGRTAMVEYIHWRVIPEGASRTIALEIGEVDFVSHVAHPDIPRLQDSPDITVTAIPGTRMFYMLFNHTLPQFQNVYFRRAIDMAIDRDAIVQGAFDGFGVPNVQQFPPDFRGSSAVGIRGYNPEGAVALLAEHGIDPASAGFEMIAIGEQQRRRAEIIQANLAEIGIPTTVSQIDLAGWFDLTNAGMHEAALSTFTTNDLLTFLRSTVHTAAIGAMNWSHYSNPELDQLIDQAIMTIDVDARHALLYDISTRVNEEVIWIPTFMDLTIRAHNANLIQPELAGNGFNFLNMVYWVE